MNLYPRQEKILYKLQYLGVELTLKFGLHLMHSFYPLFLNYLTEPF